MKKITYFMLVAAIAIVLAGCKKNNADSQNVINDFDESSRQSTVTPLLPDKQEVSPAASPTPAEESHEGQMRSYLSGQWVSEDIGTSRPYAIQFNNLKIVSNQWGISQADIVYECLVEGGITRLLGIGENFSGDRLGSVRSARHYFVSIADEYDAIYIHYGGTKYAAAKIKELGLNEMDGTQGIGTTVFYRDKSIKEPHNAFTSLERILKGIEKKKFETKYPEGYEAHYQFNEGDTDLSSDTPVRKLTLEFSSYTAPYFEYNEAEKVYYRYQFSAPHKDSNTGAQLSFKNIIVQYVKEWDIDKNHYQTMELEDAQGTGYYITNGKMIPITWKKKEKTGFMRYYNEAGEELTINPGKTYIALFPNRHPEDVRLQ